MLRYAALTLVCLAPLLAQAPSDTEIRKILADRIDTQKQGVGIVVGIVDAHGRRIVSYGSFETDGKRPVDGDTVFEIGSMTKVFTSLVMMDMAERHEIAITDPVAKYLPAEVKMPQRNGRQITFEDISMQSSGLPRLPNNMHPKEFLNPYADYTVAQLYEFLSGYELTRDIGSKYEYSNLAVGLLGHVLALRARTDYESMVRARVLQPLGMKSTSITLTPDMQARLAPGHNGALKTVPNWDLPALAGAGALRSTANDMLTFLAANLGYVKSPLAPAMADMVKKRNPTGGPGLDIAYAWHIFQHHDDPLIWHNGGTGGYRTFMGYLPKEGVGVVALSNVSNGPGVDDIGRHLLAADLPLIEPAK
jgi:CubicO group peptidase (beta-lactamase class C family)